MQYCWWDNRGMGLRPGRLLALLLRVLLLPGLLVTTGCSTLGFYSQAIAGQMALLAKRRDIEAVIADPATDDVLRQKLTLVEEVRAFAGGELGLPVDETFGSYVDTERDFVVWNVFAAKEFSTWLETFCYPIAGCVSYRGYFSEDRAQAFAESLAAEGLEVFVGGVAAYSTLGWFADPVLNTFVRRDDTRLAALLFHELAHKALYLPGDTRFNESFATALERQALKRWLASKADGTSAVAFQNYLARQKREESVIQLIDGTRQALETLYASEIPDDVKRTRKARLIDGMRASYEQLRLGWAVGNEFQNWMQGDINNARMGTVADYHGWVPAFDALFRSVDGDLVRFVAEAARISRLDAEARAARLQLLAEHGEADTGNDYNAE
ncbi:MAG: aminopeptidase [Pseudomonadota bacterium]